MTHRFRAAPPTEPDRPPLHGGGSASATVVRGRGRGGRVRQLEREDVPALAALRLRAFGNSAHGSLADAEAYFALVFFGNPWRELGLPSLVHEDRAGRLTGFLGVIPRAMRFKGEPVRVAVSTQFMVDPGERGAAGLRLLSEFLSGAQDLCFTDATNDASRRLWEELGGTTALVHSLYWAYTLRPVRFGVSQLGQHPAVRAGRLLTRPLVQAADAALRAATRRERRLARPAGVTTATLEARDVVELLPAMTERRSLLPVYDEASVRWLFDRLAARVEPGALRARLVRSPGGEPLGWYIYLRRGIVADVVQLAARPDHWRDVLRTMLAQARDEGVARMAGRVDPRHAPELAALPCAFTRHGFWSLTYSRRPELTLAVLAGDAWLSRLDAEWWVTF